MKGLVDAVFISVYWNGDNIRRWRRIGLVRRAVVVTAVVVTEEKEGHPPGRGRRHGGGGQSAAPCDCDQPWRPERGRVRRECAARRRRTRSRRINHLTHT